MVRCPHGALLCESSAQQGITSDSSDSRTSRIGSKTGDTLFTNAFVDNVVGTQDGFIRATALLYANGRDLKDPLLSPIYGDVAGFPPSILTSGTRDLYLSNTVRMHRKLRAAGVEAVLQVWEGQSHAQYMVDISAPETREYHDEVARFLDRHLGSEPDAQ